MSWLEFAESKMLKMIKLGGEADRRVGNGSLHSRTQGIGITLSAQVDNKLPTLNGCIEIRRELRHKIISHNNGHGNRRMVRQ